MKTRHKITLLFSLIVTAILLVVSLSVYYFSSLERKAIFTKRLLNRVNNNAQLFSYINDTSRVFLDRINRSSYELLPDKTVEIYDLTGHLYYRFSNDADDSTGFSTDVIQSAISNEKYFYKTGNREALAVHYSEAGNAFVVVVAAYDADGYLQLKKLRNIFYVSLLIGTLISLAAGHFFSMKLLQPVAQMINEVNDISSHNLSNRLRTGETQDELNQLASTFNELLDRLQEYFNAQRRFISNASHELSTPLTSISSQIEVTLQRDRPPEEYRQVMQSVQEDVVQMRELTKSLLEIAKTGSKGGIELNEIRIDEVLFKVMGDMKKINADYQVELNFNDSVVLQNTFLVFGNADLLYIAVKNIVENGCKYSPDHTSKVQLSSVNENTIIDVLSSGEPISVEDRNKIFHPFYRSSNAIGTNGFGLGLALAQRIVSLHKGRLDLLSSNEAGTNFVISLPTANQKKQA